jgi:hypothetical protein
MNHGNPGVLFHEKTIGRKSREIDPLTGLHYQPISNQWLGMVNSPFIKNVRQNEMKQLYQTKTKHVDTQNGFPETVSKNDPR